MTEIRLRALEPEDLELLYTIENDSTLWHVGTANVPYSRFHLHEYIANSTGDIYADKQVRLIIETGRAETIGIVDLFNFSPQHRRAEVGIVVLEQYRKRGYAYEALTQLCRYAHETLHLHQLYALIAVNQRPTISLFRKTGFKRTSSLQEWLFTGEKFENVAIMQTFLKKSRNKFWWNRKL